MWALIIHSMHRVYLTLRFGCLIILRKQNVQACSQRVASVTHCGLSCIKVMSLIILLSPCICILYERALYDLYFGGCCAELWSMQRRSGSSHTHIGQEEGENSIYVVSPFYLLAAAICSKVPRKVG